MLTATAYDTHVEQLFERIRQFHSILTAAGVPYRIVGGMAVFIHVSERDPLRARLTADVDAAIERKSLPAGNRSGSRGGLGSPAQRWGGYAHRCRAATGAVCGAFGFRE